MPARSWDSDPEHEHGDGNHTEGKPTDPRGSKHPTQEVLSYGDSGDEYDYDEGDTLSSRYTW